MTVQIYGLFDPLTGDLRYIGKANSAASRLKGHLRETRRKTPLYLWIARLRKQGLAPCMKVLRECGPEDWQAHEVDAIGNARRSGAILLNVAEGGSEPYCPTEVRAANGRNSALLRTSTPKRKRLYELKRALGTALKQGQLTERTKVKLRNLAQRHPALFGSWAAI